MKPEVLAPAGTPEALDAAVRAGADAVYFGLGAFNARARARNFADDELGPTLAKLHAHGVRGYVTLNTLIFDDELEAMTETLREVARAGADAIIVQDVGVARLARAIVPSLPVHASTQMTCTDAGSVAFAASLGARRVVLARELSLEAIRAIHAETPVPLEVFVHGALCIAYSGQCQTSEAIGGRSANRGACAQACRLPYDLVVDGRTHEIGEKSYLLSPEDLEASAHIPALIEAGVSCFKIEGRLKSAAYVAAATRLYREAVDAAWNQRTPALAPWREAAAMTYSRGFGPGFLAGVDHQRLVDGRTNEHRGTLIGKVIGLRKQGGKRLLAVRLEGSLSRGDGLFVEGGRASQGELGGLVWALFARGAALEEGRAGEEALVWLGPEQRLPDEVPAGRRVFKNGSVEAQKLTRSLLTAPAKEGRRAITFEVTGAAGRPLRLVARLADGRRAEAETEAPLTPALGRGLDEEMLRDQLGRLGGTPFSLEAVEIAADMPTDLHAPVSAINRARRSVVAALTAALEQPAADLDRDDRVDPSPLAAEPTAIAPHLEAQPWRALMAEGASLPHPAPPGGLFVLCRNVAQARAALAAGADGVYLDFLALTGTGDALRALRAEGARFVGVAPPRIRLPGEEKIDRYLHGLAPDAYLVRGWGRLQELDAASSFEGLWIGDFSLNVTNQLAIQTVLARGLHAFTPSFDLDAPQIEALVKGPFAGYAEVVLHHPTPLFHMEHCLIAALLSEGKDFRTCGRPCDRHEVSVRDRAGLVHPVEADVGCRNTIFHASAQSAVQLLPALQTAGAGRFRLELVREKPATVARLVAGYRAVIDRDRTPQSLWQELRALPDNPVVRGALRVLG